MDGPVFPRRRSGSFARIGSTGLLAAYSVALAIGTHTPLAPEETLATYVGQDAAFFWRTLVWAGLAGFRLYIHQDSRRSVWWAWLLGLALMSGMDELTQPLVGRFADWFDWQADVVGAAVGLSAAASLWNFVEIRLSPPVRRDV